MVLYHNESGSCAWMTLQGVLLVEKEKEMREEIMISLLNMFSKHGIDVTVHLLNERLQDQGSSRSFRGVHLSLSRG